jgi:hypothetical protein
LQPSVPVVAWGRARVCGSAVLEALEDKCTAVRMMHQTARAAAADGTQAAAEGDDAASEGRVSAADDDAGTATSVAGFPSQSQPQQQQQQSSSGGAAVAGALTQPSARPPPAVLRYRPDSTLPLGTGVITGAAIPVLARAWGNRLQLLQVQPAGGFPAEQTNIATEAVHRRYSPILGPSLGVPALAALQQAHAVAAAAAAAAAASPAGTPAATGAGSASGSGGRVFGSLTSTLMNVGVDSAPAEAGRVGGNGAARGGLGAPGGSGSSPVDFVLADDLPSADPIAALAWLSDNSLVYMTQPPLASGAAPPAAAAGATVVEGATSLVLLETDSLQVIGATCVCV